jgi:checkpoint serine/threonine-protein kinase
VFTEDQNKTPFITPRNPLGSKDLPTPSFTFTAAAGENYNPPLFSKVFNPPQSTSKPPLAPLRDVFTDDHGKPTPKSRPVQSHERAKSQEVPGGAPPVFTPFKDENANSKTPFKVFSRPPSEHNENAFRNAFTPKTPSAVFTPFVDGAQQNQPTFTPFGNKQQRTFTLLGDKTPFADKTHFGEKRPFAEKPVAQPPVEEEDDTGLHEPEAYDEDFEEQEERYEVDRDASMEGPEGEELREEQEQEEEYYEEQEPLEQYQTPLAPEHDEYGQYQREIPLGGRFGAFNVMTPITERTFELASTGGRTPSERYTQSIDGEGSPKGKGGFIPFLRDEMIAAAAAERLAAEVRNERIEEEEEEAEYEDGHPEHVGSDGAAQERAGCLSLVDALTLKSKFRPDNPCNPFDPPVLTTLLSMIPTDPHFYDIRDQVAETLPQLQKHFKKTARKGSSVAVGDIFHLNLNGNRFQLSEKLGEGGFGSVYKARDLGMKNLDEDEDSDMEDCEEDDEEGVSLIALKVVSPRNLWEYHVLRRLHSALPSHLRRSVVLPHALYAFGDESFLVLDYCPQGMLLDIVNNSTSAGISQAGACLDELLVVFFTIELLRLLEGMHGIGFVHGDLKIDNCLIRLEDVPGGASAWSPHYNPTGEAGWSYKGLKVIDFGRTIDTRLFPHGQEFVAEWNVDERDCFEIQEGRPWTYQTDYYGLAGIVYCMLFGKYMSKSAIAQAQGPDGQPRYKIGTPFKRYWQGEIWDKLFDALLNPSFAREDGSLPLCDEMSEMRKEMEAWLQANCNRTTGTLKGLLKKVEMSCYV